jgi:hypothetical protein
MFPSIFLATNPRRGKRNLARRGLRNVNQYESTSGKLPRPARVWGLLRGNAMVTVFLPAFTGTVRANR